MPSREGLTVRSYYNNSPECWSVYTEVLAAEYSNAVLFGQAHQLTVDSYAVQHAGGSHPDKSIAIHLTGLHLVLDRGLRPPDVPPLLQRLASSIAAWPHFIPPQVQWPVTIFDVALSTGGAGHAPAVREWSSVVWQGWKDHHSAIAALAAGI